VDCGSRGSEASRGRFNPATAAAEYTQPQLPPSPINRRRRRCLQAVWAVLQHRPLAQLLLPKRLQLPAGVAKLSHVDLPGRCHRSAAGARRKGVVEVSSAQDASGRVRMPNRCEWGAGADRLPGAMEARCRCQAGVCVWRGDGVMGVQCVGLPVSHRALQDHQYHPLPPSRH